MQLAFKPNTPRLLQIASLDELARLVESADERELEQIARLLLVSGMRQLSDTLRLQEEPRIVAAALSVLLRLCLLPMFAAGFVEAGGVPSLLGLAASSVPDVQPRSLQLLQTVLGGAADAACEAAVLGGAVPLLLAVTSASPPVAPESPALALAALSHMAERQDALQLMAKVRH
jgi:hypothetical protein